jgi:GMP reductase
MRIDNEIKLDYKDVLIRPKRSTLSSRKEVSLMRDYPHFSNFSGIPIMASNMDGVGTFEMAEALIKEKIFTCLVKTYSVEELVKFFNSNDYNIDYVAMSIGTSEEDFNKLCDVYEQTQFSMKYVCMDIANGYSEHFVERVRQVREKFPFISIIAGNVVTADQTQELILNGATIVKVGIGPGSVCTTRIQTGVGYPQLSAVIECADAAHGLGGYIIADGGCTTPGDVSKAFGAGADFVMLGGMLAGHDEGGGQVFTKFYETDEIEYEVLDHLERRRQYNQQVITF